MGSPNDAPYEDVYGHDAYREELRPAEENAASMNTPNYLTAQSGSQRLRPMCGRSPPTLYSPESYTSTVLTEEALRMVQISILSSFRFLFRLMIYSTIIFHVDPIHGVNTIGKKRGRCTADGVTHYMYFIARNARSPLSLGNIWIM